MLCSFSRGRVTPDCLSLSLDVKVCDYSRAFLDDFPSSSNLWVELMLCHNRRNVWQLAFIHFIEMTLRHNSDFIVTFAFRKTLLIHNKRYKCISQTDLALIYFTDYGTDNLTKDRKHGKILDCLFTNQKHLKHQPLQFLYTVISSYIQLFKTGINIIYHKYV